jgi:hypothetical protein
MEQKDFEQQVLTSLSVIEEKLDGLEKSKSTTYDNERALLLQDMRIKDLESTIKGIKGAIVSIIVALIIALLRYIFNI